MASPGAPDLVVAGASPHFRDRVAAGRQLALEVGRRFGIPTAVAAVSLPGGLVALSVARAFARPLTFAYCAPLLLPWDDEPHAAFGAVDPDGHAVLDYPALAAFRLSSQEIETARARALDEIRRFYAQSAFPPLDAVLPTPRLMLVDEGLSPGWRMEAAVAFARRRRISRVLVGAPCASPGGARWFESDADGFVALSVDETPTGQHFAAFDPVDMSLLEAYRHAPRMHHFRAGPHNPTRGVS
jgi:putative phosphoribosyl transferase